MPETVAGFVNLLVSILTLMALFGGGYVVVKKWVRRTANQVETSNGSSVGQYTEHTAKKVDGIEQKQDMMNREVTTLVNYARDNKDSITEVRDIALRAEVKADATSARLDAFIAGYTNKDT